MGFETRSRSSLPSCLQHDHCICISRLSVNCGVGGCSMKVRNTRVLEEKVRAPISTRDVGQNGWWAVKATP